MTSSDRPDRPAAAGVFVVRDPEVCSALEALLQPHYTGPAPGTLVTAPSGAAVLADAIAHATELLGKPTGALSEYTGIEPLLDLAYTEGNVAGQTKAAAEGREWSAQQTSLVSGLEKQVEQLQVDLATAVEQIEASRKLHKQARSEAEELQDSKHALQTDLAHAEHRITELERDLTKAKNVAPVAPKPLDGRTARGKDRKAFAALADRMDREALSQSKTVAGVLRTAAKSVRDEIEIVYGHADRAAS